MSLTHQALRVITRDVSKILKSPPEDVRIRVREGDIGGEGGIVGIVRGPEGTPYAGGYFYVAFSFLNIDYPNQPPKCTMLTKIFHPNISKSGEICVDTLKRAWTRNLGIVDVLVTIKCLLIHPNPESALDEEAGKLLLEDYKEYARMAKLMSSIHATPKVPPEEFLDEEASRGSIKTAATPATSATLAPPLPQAIQHLTHTLPRPLGAAPQSCVQSVIAMTKSEPVHVQTGITLSNPQHGLASAHRAPTRGGPKKGLKRL